MLAGRLLGVVLLVLAFVAGASHQGWWPGKLLLSVRDRAAPPPERLRADVANAYEWCQLAEWLEESGELVRAQKAIEIAASLGHNLAPVRMRAANFYFNRGDNAAALRHAAEALRLTDAYDAILFSYYRRLELPRGQVLAIGLPPQARAWHAYFLHLLSWEDPGPVAALWQTLRERYPPGQDLTIAYVNYLVRKGEWEQAASVWRTHNLQESPGYGASEYVFNGGFEAEFTPVPLDWRSSPAPGVRLERSQVAARTGQYGLEIEFLGEENVFFRHLSQITVLPAGQYEFQAWIRARNLTTDQRPYFHLAANLDPSWTTQTPQFPSDSDWFRLSLVFQLRRAGPVTIELRRDRSLKIDSKIRGTVQVDDVSIRPLAR